MSSAALDGIRLKKALATLREIEQEVKDKQRWMATLSSFKGNPIDAKELLNISTQIMSESMTLERAVSGLAGEARSLSRSIPSMPPKQLTMNKYSASSVGELRELTAMTGRVSKQLVDFRSAVTKFRGFALEKMNDPDRTSDGQPLDPLGMLLELLKLFIKWRNLG